MFKKGDKVGRLTILSRTHEDGKKISGYWDCVCECGVEKKVRQDHLRTKKTRSCGCLAREEASKKFKTHGMSKTKTYKCWVGLKYRCDSPNATGYEKYGGRGIGYCDRWKDFENFYEDMGPRPSDKHSIDRIDNDGDYCPENCKWATLNQQSINKRSTKKHIGVIETASGNFRTSFSHDNVVKFLGTYATAVDAATVYDDSYEEVHGFRPNKTVSKNPPPKTVVKNKNKFKGVFCNGNGFCARIGHSCKTYYLGNFTSREEAAKAYDDKFEEFNGNRPNNTEKET